MAEIAFWWLLLTLTLCSSQILQKPILVDPKYSKLTLHYDHCKHPMTFSKDKLICVCPEPLLRIGDTCICDDCIHKEVMEMYTGGLSDDVPQYIDEILEEFEEESHANMHNEEPLKQEQNNESQRGRRNIDEGSKEENNIAKSYSILYLKGTNKSQNLIPIERTAEGFRRVFQSNNMSEKNKYRPLLWVNKKLLTSKGESFSVIGSSAKGWTQFGGDKTLGYIDSRKGSGAMALGSGGGSAASAAAIGPGKSDMTVFSDGASAKGLTMVGSKAKNALSTNTILAGSAAHAVAVNARGEKGVASGAAVSTGKAAVAATSALGKASASAAAANEKNETVKGIVGHKIIGHDLASSTSIGNSKEKYLKQAEMEANDVDTSSFTFKPKSFKFGTMFN